MLHDSLFKLADGRNLSFIQCGDATGKPVFYFHGFPGSRLEATVFHQQAQQNNILLIGIDRPGMGLSAFDQNKSLASWTKDISALADYLKINKFSILGHSGGAPFVAACLALIPERINSAAIVSGMAPLNHPLSKQGMPMAQKIVNKLVQLFPPLASLMVRATRMMLNKPDMLMKQVGKQLAEPDLKIFRDPQQQQMIINSTLQAFRQGLRGPAEEFKLLLKPWEFELGDIDIPISIWQGNADKQVPVSHAMVYKHLLPNAQLHIIENEGHHSLIRNYFSDILIMLNL